MNNVTVGQIYDLIDDFAPFCLTDKFDNTGILVGDKSRQANKIMLCLDITNDVVDEAVSRNVDLIISHHPVIFNPIYTLCCQNPAILMEKRGISAICAHTNLDKAKGGVNDILLSKLGLASDEVFEVTDKIPYYQISVFAPVENADDIINAMSDAGAGTLGCYERCAFSCEGNGTFLPLQGSDAYIGKVGKVENVKESRIEMIVPHFKRKAVITAMLNAHPYEKPAYTLVENQAIIETFGYGRICRLERDYTASELVLKIKKALNNTVIRYNDENKPIRTIAICSGSGGSNVDKAIKMGVDAYICGDIKHDQFIDAHNSGLTLIDAGHFHTENIFIETIKKIINDKYPEIEVLTSNNSVDILKYAF